MENKDNNKHYMQYANTQLDEVQQLFDLGGCCLQVVEECQMKFMQGKLWRYTHNSCHCVVCRETKNFANNLGIVYGPELIGYLEGLNKKEDHPMDIWYISDDEAMSEEEEEEDDQGSPIIDDTLPFTRTPTPSSMSPNYIPSTQVFNSPNRSPKGWESDEEEIEK